MNFRIPYDASLSFNGIKVIQTMVYVGVYYIYVYVYTCIRVLNQNDTSA